MHYVVFEQAGVCSPPLYAINWTVTLGSKTEMQRANGTSNPNLQDSADKNYSIIVFPTSDGTYHYSTTGANFDPGSGTVVVNGSDVLVELVGPLGLHCPL